MGDPNRKSVMVVGAGASREFGLPTGVELLNSIAGLANMRFSSEGRSFEGDHQLYETFKESNEKKENYDGTANEQLHRCWFIRDNAPLAPSIDNFLHTHQSDQLLVETGKALIAKAILDAEKNSTLLHDRTTASPRINFSASRTDGKSGRATGSPASSWMGELFKLMVSGKSYDEFRASIDTITFISFNYDRCIQQFLSYAAISYFSLSLVQAQELLRSIRVIHPYGSLGDLYLDSSGSSNFGEDLYRSALLDAASRLRTFTEGLVDVALTEEISDAFSQASNVIFLGFGFIPINMDLLFEKSPYNVERVLGTCKGLSEESSSSVESALSGALFYGGERARGVLLQSGNKKAELSDVTCSELFRKHWIYFLGSGFFQ